MPVNGLTLTPRPTASPAEIAVRERARRVGPSCPGRSPAIFPVASQILHKLFECEPGYRLTRRQRGKWPLRRGQPAFSKAFFLKWGEARFRLMWHDLSDGAAAIGNHDRLTRRGQSDVFAQLVLQDLKPDRAFEVSSPKKLLCLFAPARGADLAAPVALIDTATTGRYVKR